MCIGTQQSAIQVDASDTLVAMILQTLGSVDWPKLASVHKALLTPGPEQPNLTLTKAESSFSSLQSVDPKHFTADVQTPLEMSHA